MLSSFQFMLAAGRGFEPRLTGSEPASLPLADPAMENPLLF